jgi:hypothetical protein
MATQYGTVHNTIVNGFLLATGDKAGATTEGDDGIVNSDNTLLTAGDIDKLLRRANDELGEAVPAHTDRGETSFIP